MQQSRKWITVVIIVWLAGSVASVSAQKGKPTPPATPVWSVEMSGPNIAGEGLTSSQAVVLDVRVWGTPKRDNIVQPCNNCTVFRIEVKAPWNPAIGGPFIEFKDVQLEDEFNPYERTPNCNFPSFDGGVVTNPVVPAPKVSGCMEAFLSHKHPQAPYNRAMLQVMVAGDALAMPVGTPLESKGFLATQVTGTDCHTSPAADQAYFATMTNYGLAPWPDSTGESVNVVRTATNQWTVNVFRSTGLIDEVFSGPDPKFDTCGHYFAWYSYTKPLATTMYWSLK